MFRLFGDWKIERGRSPYIAGKNKLAKPVRKAGLVVVSWRNKLGNQRAFVLTAKFACILLLVAWNTAQANDGFYQGSGSTLSPVNNSYLRVRTETLVIRAISPPVCYSVYANGHPITDNENQTMGPQVKVTVGPSVKCGDGSADDLVVKWSADANYEIEARQSQHEVQIGFPVSTWEREYVDSVGMGELDAPGIANFQTFIDDAEVKHTEVKVLKPRKGDQHEQIGYAWRASFEQGKTYRLRTRYQYGEFASNGYYDGREFHGARPWFLKSGALSLPAGTMLYFLTPLQSWAPPPPESITIELHLPSDIPVTYAIFHGVKPVCLSSNVAYYSIRHQFPKDDLGVTLPRIDAGREALQTLRTAEQWKKWLAALDNPRIKVECGVVNQIRKRAAPDLQAALDKFQCVSSCQAE